MNEGRGRDRKPKSRDKISSRVGEEVGDLLDQRSGAPQEAPPAA